MIIYTEIRIILQLTVLQESILQNFSRTFIGVDSSKRRKPLVSASMGI